MSRAASRNTSPSTPGLAAAIVEAARRARLGIVVRNGGGGGEPLFENQFIESLLGGSTGSGTLSLPGRADEKLDAWRQGAERCSGVIKAKIDVRGESSPVEIVASHTSVGGVAAEVLFLFDTAERQKTERALLASETRFRELLEAAPDAIAIGTRERFMYANPALMKLLAHERPGDVTSKPLRELLHPEDKVVAKALVERLVETGEPQPPTAIRIKKKSGGYAHAELRTMVIEWDGQSAFLGIGRDITERHRMQAQLIRADRLTAVGTLAAGIAHEINNPLAYVLLNLQYLSRELPRYDGRPEMIERLLERLAEAQHGARRVSTIVSDLRAFARPEHENEEPVRVSDVLRSAIKVAGNAIRRRARLVENVTETSPVLASGARLEQVFVNLLVNAAQAIAEGHPSDNEIRVAVEERDKRVFVEIADTGEGIAEELRARVFDPFFTTKPRGTGTGLGLPISHSIVSSYGGEITLESAPKQGTTFRVSLPVFEGVFNRRSLTPPPQPVEPRRWRGKLLVVDDEPLVADMLERTLEEDHEVTIATDAEKALELLLNSDFDVVFCDLLMPGKSGMDLYAELKARRPGVEERMVFMTGGAFTPRASQFLATVPNRTIVKPFDLSEIERVLSDCARNAMS